MFKALIIKTRVITLFILKFLSAFKGYGFICTEMKLLAHEILRFTIFLNKYLFNTWFRHYRGHYALPQIFTVGGATWSLDPSMEAVNCEIILTNNKFIWLLFNILAYNNWTIETYYSLLKSHLALQICTVSYVQQWMPSIL